VPPPFCGNGINLIMHYETTGDTKVVQRDASSTGTVLPKSRIVEFNPDVLWKTKRRAAGVLSKARTLVSPALVRTAWRLTESQKPLPSMFAKPLMIADILGDHIDRGMPAMLTHLEQIRILPPCFGKKPSSQRVPRE